jgi:hypothetical protein
MHVCREAVFCVQAASVLLLRRQRRRACEAAVADIVGVSVVLVELDFLDRGTRLEVVDPR